MRYTFDVPLIASVTVEAADPNEARRRIQAALESASVEIAGLVSECSLTEEVEIDRHLAQVNGVDCLNQYARRQQQPTAIG